MRYRPALIAVPLAAAIIPLAACSSTGGKAATTAHNPAMPSLRAVPSPTTPAAVAAVPGSSNNEYRVGPFDVHMTEGVTRLPSRFDDVTESGADIPQYGSVIVVRNISGSFSGWVSPQIEYVKGHSVKGEVIDTESADPDAGGEGGRSDPLTPGQSETLYATYQGAYKGFVEAQLNQVTYGPTGTGELDGTVVNLKY